MKAIGKLVFPCYHYQFPVVSSMGSRILIQGARRTGKTYCCTFLALQHAVAFPGSHTLYITPYQGMIAGIIDYVDQIMQIQGEVQGIIKKQLKNPPSITLQNDSVIHFLTPSQVTTRGRGIDVGCLILEEVASMDDATVDTILKTLCLKPESRLVVASTPRTNQGAFWEWATNEEHGFEKHHWPMSVLPGNETAIKLMKESLTTEQFKRECLAEFV